MKRTSVSTHILGNSSARSFLIAALTCAVLQNVCAPDASAAKWTAQKLSTHAAIQRKLAALAQSKKTGTVPTPPPTTAPSTGSSPGTTNVPAQPAVVLPVGSSSALTWTQVANFLSDYKPGGPAAGWTYAWNPTGTLGNSQTFAPLLWSNVAQAYNTTGAATRVPTNNITHNDDYLSLYAGVGSPGKPNYLPIIGYTVQPGDGDGSYRLSDSSIAKWDGVVSANEDGLGVLVYLNNTLLPPSTTVATNGLVSTFDRDLGELTVGDKIWVMVSALTNQNDDAFRNFDFTIQKLTAEAAIPEPGTASLVIIGLAACHWRRRRSGKS